MIILALLNFECNLNEPQFDLDITVSTIPPPDLNFSYIESRNGSRLQMLLNLYRFRGTLEIRLKSIGSGYTCAF